MHPVDRRIVAVRMYSILHSQRKVAHLLGVAASTICRWLKHPTRKEYSKRPSKVNIVVDTIKLTLEGNPFITICQLQDKIYSIHGFYISRALLHCAIHTSGFTYKKAKRFSKPSYSEQKRMEFLDLRSKYINEGYTFLCLDETSFGRHSTAKYGYSRKGRMLLLENKSQHMTTTTAIAAMNKAGADAAIGKLATSCTGCHKAHKN